MTSQANTQSRHLYINLDTFNFNSRVFECFKEIRLKMWKILIWKSNDQTKSSQILSFIGFFIFKNSKVANSNSRYRFQSLLKLATDPKPDQVYPIKFDFRVNLIRPIRSVLLRVNRLYAINISFLSLLDQKYVFLRIPQISESKKYFFRKFEFLWSISCQSTGVSLKQAW